MIIIGACQILLVRESCSGIGPASVPSFAAACVKALVLVASRAEKL